MSEIKVSATKFSDCVYFDAALKRIFDSIYRATTRSRIAENMRHHSSYLVSASKNEGESHDKADVGRPKIASTAVRARGSARVCVCVRMCVRAYVMRATGVRFPQRNNGDDSDDDFVEGTEMKKEDEENERAREKGRKKKEGG